ncbi:phenylalanine--tRNA ligase subunit beta-related protein [Psychrobacter proteolyticus]|uniref:phenylalanine--tRNA ligase subunit beta-related protein n=1 Tax=Psychrobacter proteolyticus TaxID=147825 RepID=UPI001D12550C|nr:hypothetical protein [Psychrobacter proteolyticus]
MGRSISLSPLLTIAREKSHAIKPQASSTSTPRYCYLDDSDISLQTLETTVRTAAGDLLTDLWLFDVYQGDKVPEGQTLTGVCTDMARCTQTLSDETVKTATDKVVQALTDQHSVQLRDC